MSSVKNVAVLGASGNLGPSIVAELLKANYNVSVFVRPTSSAQAPAGAKLVKTDYSHESLREVLKGHEAVVSTLSPEAAEATKAAIDVSAELGVLRFIPPEFGSDTSNPKIRELIPIFESKKALVDYLRTKEDKLSWTAIATGAFADWGIKTGFLGFYVKDRKADIWDNGTATNSISTLAQVGRATAKVLQNLESTANQYVFVESFTTTQNEILATLEKLTGDKFAITEKSPQEEIPKNLEKLGKGDYSIIGHLILGPLYLSEESYGDWKHVGGSWNKKLGLEKEDLEEVLRAAIN